MLLLVDIHAHMDIHEFIGMTLDIDEVMKRCVDKGVVAIVGQGVNIESNRETLKLAKIYPLIKPALGIYPTHCFEMITQGKQKEFDDEIAFIDGNLAEKKAIAIGEVGLDYKEVEPNDENKKILKGCLIKFIDLAKKHDVPIILHSRLAELDLIEYLEQEGMKNKKVIMHCFSGRKHLVKRIIENGWFLTVPAIVTRLEHFQYVARDCPLSQIFTETDSPMLSPDPSTLNDPSNVIYAIKKIAEIKGMDENEVANIIYNNYQRIFM